ncbi:MAG: hypothetical protein IJO94_06060, partial [Firmicutes bacterium]|nr:hypothetical protein [Bacillota bacterium]
MQYIKVLINKKIKELDRDFIYEVPSEWIGLVKIGSVVSVPFGHTTEKGIVVGFADSPGDFQVKYIDAILNEEFSFPEDLLVLANDLSHHYNNTTIGMLKAMIPGGINLFGEAQKAKQELWLVLSDNDAIIRGTKQKALAELLVQKKEISFQDALKLGYSNAVCNGLVKNGFAKKELRTVKRYSYGHIKDNFADIP